MLPHEIELALHVFVLARHDDDGVLLRQNDGVLAEGAIAAEGGALAAPELVAIALQPVVLRFWAVWFIAAGLLDVFARGFLDPRDGQKLLALPLAFLQQELAKLREAFALNAESPAAGGDAARAGLPAHVADAERGEEPRREILQQAFASDLLDDSGAHVGSGAVVHELRAGRVRDIQREKGSHPVLRGHAGLCRLFFMAAGHGE